MLGVPDTHLSTSRKWQHFVMIVGLRVVSPRTSLSHAYCHANNMTDRMSGRCGVLGISSSCRLRLVAIEQGALRDGAVPYFEKFDKGVMVSSTYYYIAKLL